MKSRFGAYLAAAKLAKLHLVAAEEAAKKEHDWNFEHNLFRALENMLVAMNCAASIGFNSKPKRKRS